jgi:hypothetical protein
MGDIAMEPYGKHPHTHEDVFPATASPADSFDDDEVKQVQARDYDPRYGERYQHPAAAAATSSSSSSSMR